MPRPRQEGGLYHQQGARPIHVGRRQRSHAHPLPAAGGNKAQPCRSTGRSAAPGACSRPFEVIRIMSILVGRERFQMGHGPRIHDAMAVPVWSLDDEWHHELASVGLAQLACRGSGWLHDRRGGVGDAGSPPGASHDGSPGSAAGTLRPSGGGGGERRAQHFSRKHALGRPRAKDAKARRLARIGRAACSHDQSRARQDELRGVDHHP